MTRARENADHAQLVGGAPHIIPDVLHPAIAGKLLDGTTSHGSTYGVAQSDGRMYYYTDIKGSKPIKDPRIGAHFGSQRHKFKSLQLLEQETAMAGHPVSSIDGREWVRTHGASWHVKNDGNGNSVANHDGAHPDANDWIEITGYFNKINWIALILSNSSTNVNVVVDGVSASTSFAPDATGNSPILGRFVDGSSLQELPVGTLSLGIHTVKIGLSTTYWYANGVELIAQDTSNVNKLQIPSQNVVSYGKKFTVAETKHYNPFAFKTDGSTVWASGAHNGTAWPIGTGSSTNIDTATSLGLAAWVSTNYYKPYNGGRVVKWVASDGTIKTSVNMMPPNARNIGPTAAAEKGDDSAGTSSAAVANNTYLPTFTDQAIDHSQAEVAKTFNWREFGNGSANGGTGATYADVSMLSPTFDNIAYVMDDGLTSFSGYDIKSNGNNPDLNGSGGYVYLTFIGTGFTVSGLDGTENIVQNLPYGTHILKFKDSDIHCDGVEVHSSLNIMDNSNKGTEYTFHQPKMPPIPEDAVIISDYMLMADYVRQTTAGQGIVSKGTRYLHSSRDVFYNSGATINYAQGAHGHEIHNQNASSVGTVPFFGTNSVETGYGNGGSSNRFVTKFNNATIVNGNLINSGGGYWCSNTHDGAALGINTMQVEDGINNHFNVQSFQLVSPIHTSSHYKFFETPYLMELVGGDRNMEQNNLVVTPDGKTWDEVTRKTDYLSNTSLVVKNGTDSWNTNQFWSVQRGKSSNLNMMSKEWITGYDQWICLVGGRYQIGGEMLHRRMPTAGHSYLRLNGNIIASMHTISSDSGGNDHSVNSFNTIFEAKRGDYLYITGEKHGGQWSTINIKRI